MVTEAVGRYGLDLPDDEIVSQRFRFQIDYWKNRNKYIADVREMLNGLNKIQAPISAQYKVRTLHTYILASLINEKVARFLPRPVIQVIPDDEVDDDSQEQSTRHEQWLNVASYELERRGDGDVWGRVLTDAILLDEGVEKVLRAPAAFWTELVADTLGDGEEYPLMSAKRNAYKKEHGIPITKSYVPLEMFFPVYDGPTLMESWEVEERSLLSIRNNALFDSSMLDNYLPASDRDGGLSTTCNIVHYANKNWYGYYLGSPKSYTPKAWPKVNSLTGKFEGNLKLLYAFRHDLGRSPYNCVGGRFGGWKTNNNRIEGVGKGLLELNQAADEIVSQVLTNVRAKYWPSPVFKMDPEKRGQGVGNTKPEPPTVKEGEPITLFVGEEIDSLFKAEEDPMAMWIYDTIQQQIGKLGGSAVLFGDKSPGVDTGYHQALQTTQAESLDEKIENNASAGAINEATLVLLHAREINEPIFANYVEESKTGQKRGKYISLDPKELYPLPRLDAQVRKQRPVDYIAALRAAREASDDRGGKGPLLSDRTIRTDILALEAADIEESKILVESQKREVIASGVLSQKIGDQINIKLAQKQTMGVNPSIMAGADPALLAAIQASSPAAAGAGGISPQVLAGAAQPQAPQAMPSGAPGVGLPPGPVPGESEPENRLGEAVSNAVNTGASI